MDTAISPWVLQAALVTGLTGLVIGLVLGNVARVLERG